MKLYYIASLLTLCWVAASGQNSLSGIITNTNNEPIPATIFLPQLEKGSAADLEGNFKIQNIPDGTYIVIVSHLGHTSHSTRLEFEGNEDKVLNWSLEQTAVEMQEVIISTPFHKLQGDNVMRVEQISANSIISSGSSTLADGISQITGVQNISTGSGIGKPVIRGLSANRVLTYSQGTRLENQQFGDEHGLGINEAGISSIEVIKGPASLLYGSDALGGVLYLIPERFAASNTFEADGRSSFFSNTRGSASTIGLRTSGEVFKFLVRGAYSSHSDYETGSDIRVTNTRFNEFDLKSGVRYQNNKFLSTLRYNYNRANIGIPEEIGEQSSSKDLLTPFQEIDNHILSLDNTFFLPNSSIDLTLGYLHNDRREFEEEEGGNSEEPVLRLKLNTFNYDLKYNLPKSLKLDIIFGVQGLFQKNENFGEEVLIPNANVFDIGLFGTAHIHLEKIDLLAGLRFDNRGIQSESANEANEPDFIPALDTDFNSFNAALGAKFDLGRRVITRLNLASGFRAPNLAELTSNGIHEGTNRYELGNPDLDNEQNLQVDLSIEYGNEHFEIFGNGFYNAISDYIFLTPTGDMIDGNFVFEYVQDDAKLYGGELGLHIHPHPLDWLHLESAVELVVGKLNNGGYLPLIPATSISNTLRTQFSNGKLINEPYTFIRLKNTLDQENNSAFEGRTGGYSLLDLGGGLTFHFANTEISVWTSVTNIFDKKYVAHLSRLKTDGILNQGRNIVMGAKVAL